jgi:thiol-disulfide isomerase/thioredoxin
VAAAVAAAVASTLALGGGTSTKPAARAGAAGGKPVLRLQGADPVTGKTVSLAAFSGKPIVLNLWTSGCASCVAEARALTRFERGHPGAQVVGIDVADSRTGAISFYQQVGWRHPSIADPSGRIAAHLRLETLPTTLFLDAKHRVVARINGQTSLAGFTAGYRKASA